MKCSNCNDHITDESKVILINADGDFVCNALCEKDYNLKRDRFFSTIVHSERLTERWLLGDMN